MVAGRPGGVTSRRSTRLQPGPSASSRAFTSFATLPDDALVALTAQDLDEHEQQDVTVDLEQLRRRWEDQQQIFDLQRVGFAGPRYEMFRADLAAYGYPVVRSWIRRGLIFQHCAERGRPVPVRPQDREYLATPGNDGDAADDRRGLALETNARALRFFREHVLVPGTWSMDKGASIDTFYVGACLFAFPNVYQRWAGERRRTAPPLAGEPAAPDDVPVWTPHGSNRGVDPAVSAVSAIAVEAELQAMPARTREVATLLVNEDASFAEIGEELGMSARAVEGVLYRYRFEAKRRHLRGRLA